MDVRRVVAPRPGPGWPLPVLGLAGAAATLVVLAAHAAAGPAGLADRPILRALVAALPAAALVVALLVGRRLAARGW